MNDNLKNKEKFLRTVFSLLAGLCLLLNIYSFYTTIFLNRITSDDCLWTPSYSTSGKFQGLKISNIIPDGVSDAAGIKENDILLAINGQIFSNPMEAMSILNQHSNEYITYTIIRNNQILNFDIWVYKLINVLFIILWLLGLGFLFVGFVVGYSKPLELTSKLLYFIGITSSLGLILYSEMPVFANMGNINGFREILINMYFGAALISVVLISPLFFHFFITYPIKRDFKHRKELIAALYILPILIVSLEMFINYIFHRPIFNFSKFSAQILPVLLIISGVIVFISSIKKMEDIKLRKSVLIIRNGFIIGAIGFVYYLIFFLYNSKPYFLVKPIVYIPIILVLAIPISFGYSIIKYRILDTEYLIKKSIVLSIVSFLILLFYLLLVYFLDKFIGQYIQNSKQIFIIAFIIIVTFTFDYVNSMCKDLVDRVFYREKYNYRKSLLRFSEEIAYISDINEIILKIKNEIYNSIGIDILKIWITNKDYCDFIKLPSELVYSTTDLVRINSLHHKLFKSNAEPVVLYSAFFKELKLSDEETYFINYQNIKLSIPLFLDNRFLGSINFGGKMSGKEYSEEDIDLLKTISIQIPVSLENNRLHQIEYKNKIIEEELRIAKNIQNDLFPKFDIIHDKYQIRGISIPAKVIGGDFYDIIEIEKDKYLTIVADAAGKGIPAALYMAKLQSMIQFASNLFLSPKELLIEINKQIYEQMDRKYFITALIVLFDFKSGYLTIARAGHLPLRIFNSAGHTQIMSKGMGLGLENGKIFDANLEEVKLKIENNSLYFLYTDGLNEAMDKDKNEYGSERLNDLILKNRNNDVKEIEGLILKDISAFRGNAVQYDDITFEIIKTI